MKQIEEEKFKIEYNEEHGYVPKTIIKDIRECNRSNYSSRRMQNIMYESLEVQQE